MHESNPVPYYFNKATSESRYTVPPSCAWTRNSLDGHPVYVNTVTHQAVWARPPSLCWKLLHAPGERSTCAPFIHQDVSCAASQHIAHLCLNAVLVFVALPRKSNRFISTCVSPWRCPACSSQESLPIMPTLQPILVQLRYRGDVCGDTSRATS